jgi:hypothetical protein
VIKNPHIVKEFEDDLARRHGRPDYPTALRIFTSLWMEGQSLGVLPPEDPMDGIETDIKVARILNSCSKASLPE